METIYLTSNAQVGLLLEAKRIVFYYKIHTPIGYRPIPTAMEATNYCNFDQLSIH